MFHELETDRLILKNIGTDDRDFILREFGDADISEYLFDEEPFTTLEEADGLIEFYTQPEPRMQHRWILALKETGEKIGTCGYHCVYDGRAEMGYDMRKEYWGRGLMSEAVREMLKFGAREMGLREVDAHIAEGNARSVALVKRLGFEDCGEDFTLEFHGKNYRHQVYRLKIV